MFVFYCPAGADADKGAAITAWRRFQTYSFQTIARQLLVSCAAFARAADFAPKPVSDSGRLESGGYKSVKKMLRLRNKKIRPVWRDNPSKVI